jgi:iron(III) transport system permease protein
LLVFSLAFVMPVMRLLYWAVPNMDTELTTQFWAYVAGSTSLSLLAMLMIAGLALLMAFSARTYNSPFAKIVVRISTMGYALPGTVLAVGLFVPVAAIDNALGAMGLSTPLLQGTMVVMLLAYSVRFMAVAFSPLESNLLRITPSIDAASRSLGVSGIKMLAKVHLPMVKGGLLTAMVLVFVDVMKELPITLMTRPFGFNTLAVRIFELSSEGLWERAALPALAIVLVGLIPAFILIRKSDVR